MAKGKSKSVSDKNQYTAYKSENRLMKNRMRRIIRHIINFPEDLIAKKALEKMEKNGVPYRRKKPQGHGFPPQKKVKKIKYAYGYIPKSLSQNMK